MARNFQFSVGEYYHVYNRGVDKRVVFTSDADKVRFQKLLFLCNSTKIVHLSELTDQHKGEDIYKLDRETRLVDIGLYAIMDNHFHLLLKELRENGISLFMQKLMTAYTMYFNILNDRTGALFQGRFKAKHVQNDAHLKYLFACIHLNVRDLFGSPNIQKIASYKYSSLADYLHTNARRSSAVLSLKNFPDYFKTHQDRLDELSEWLDYGSEDNFKVEP